MSIYHQIRYSSISDKLHCKSPSSLQQRSSNQRGWGWGSPSLWNIHENEVHKRSHSSCTRGALPCVDVSIHYCHSNAANPAHLSISNSYIAPAVAVALHPPVVSIWAASIFRRMNTGHIVTIIATLNDARTACRYIYQLNKWNKSLGWWVEP